MAEDLQLDRAEFTSGEHCAMCHTALFGNYYRLLNDTVCPTCAEKAKNTWGDRQLQAGGFLKAFLYGAGAAFVGFLVYLGVALIFHIELALIAIFIGWFVGKAMMKATNGIGGRKLQITAVLLTYLAVCAGSLPAAMQTLVEWSEKQPKEKDDKPLTTGQKIIAVPIMVAMVVGITVAVPFFNIASFSGVIGALIIFFGIQRAWRETAGAPFALYGPFKFERAANAAG